MHGLSYKSLLLYAMCARLQRFLTWIHSHFRFIQLSYRRKMKFEDFHFRAIACVRVIYTYFCLPNLCNLWTCYELKWNEMIFVRVYAAHTFPKHTYTSVENVCKTRAYVHSIHHHELARWKFFQIESRFNSKNNMTKHGNVQRHVNKRVAAINFSSCPHPMCEYRKQKHKLRNIMILIGLTRDDSDVRMTYDVFSRCILLFDCFYIRSIDLNYLVMLPHIHKISNELGYGCTKDKEKIEMNITFLCPRWIITLKKNKQTNKQTLAHSNENLVARLERTNQM